MMLFLASGARLAAGASAILAMTVTFAPATHARDRRAARQIIEEIAPPTRGSFDEIIVQLPPLAPAPRKVAGPPAAAPATPSVARSDAEPATAAPVNAQAQHETETQTAAQGPAPETVAPSSESRTDQPPADSATAGPEQPIAPIAQTAPSGAPTSVETQTNSPSAQGAVEAAPPKDSAPVEAQSEAAAPAANVAAAPELRGSEPVQSSIPETQLEAPPQSPIAENARTEAAPPVEVAKPVAEPPNAAGEGQEDGSFFELWQLIVAAFALGGLLVSRRRRTGKATPAVDTPAVDTRAAAPAPSKIAVIFAAAKSAWTKFAPLAMAKIAKLREAATALRRKRSATGAAAPASAAVVTAGAGAKTPRLSKAHWAEIAATLRAKITPPKLSPAVPGREKAGVVASSPAPTTAAASATAVLEAERWDQADRDMPELLEPGASSTQAIVMNARRKFRAAQA